MLCCAAPCWVAILGTTQTHAPASACSGPVYLLRIYRLPSILTCLPTRTLRHRSSLPLTSCPAHCQLYSASLAFPCLKHCLIPLVICSGIAACTVVINAVHCCRSMDLRDLSPGTAAQTLWFVHCYRHFPCSSIHSARPQMGFVASCVCPCENMLSIAPVC